MTCISIYRIILKPIQNNFKIIYVKIRQHDSSMISTEIKEFLKI